MTIIFDQITVQLVRINCCSCGVTFAMPDYLKDKLKESHERFYCPNGHKLYFKGESEAEKLKRQLSQKENELAQKITANIQLDNQLTKIRKDIASGKCPCCNNTYKHLSKHMANKHPKFK